MKKLLILSLFSVISFCSFSNPIDGLLERIDKGASKKFRTEIIKSPDGHDFFELDQRGNKVVVRGNNYVSIAVGINWYLKYHAGIHLSWNGMKAKLPARLPAVERKERHDTEYSIRYYLNYCTFSYSMAFWDWERWQQEIDWMALHGVNLPLAITGTEAVWYNIMSKLGYNKEEIGKFIAGSGFLAWWQMNNLEGWGGPNPESWYTQQAELQKKIITRMREFGIEPVLPGYAGMIPADAGEKLGVDISDPGQWCGFPRPAFLQPTDPAFEKVSDLYYSEMTKLFGKSRYYAIDPFHEGGSTEGVNLDLAGKTIMAAMKKANPEAVWVAQAWQVNPRQAMIENLDRGDLLILDLFSESRPQWGAQWSSWCRPNGYGKHDWVFCMLLNFGGRTGMHGKMQVVADQFYEVQRHAAGRTLKGIGATMEAIENNPVMYELLFELPWRDEHVQKDEWLKGYVTARYGVFDRDIYEAWRLLSNSVYGYPAQVIQEGPTETVFAANPGLKIGSVSCCSVIKPWYNTDSVRMAAHLMMSVADRFRGNNNFEYDLVDVMRQAMANRGYYLYRDIQDAYNRKDADRLETLSEKFLDMILAQDSLLQTKPEFRVGTWTEQARKIGNTLAEKDLYEWNARTQITVWGTRNSAFILHNYAYKEWSGVLRDVYYPRWKKFFENLEKNLQGMDTAPIDYFAMDELWNNGTDSYVSAPEGDAVERAKIAYDRYVNGEW